MYLSISFSAPFPFAYPPFRHFSSDSAIHTDQTSSSGLNRSAATHQQILAYRSSDNRFDTVRSSFANQEQTPPSGDGQKMMIFDLRSSLSLGQVWFIDFWLIARLGYRFVWFCLFDENRSSIFDQTIFRCNRLLLVVITVQQLGARCFDAIIRQRQQQLRRWSTAFDSESVYVCVFTLPGNRKVRQHAKLCMFPDPRHT